MSAAHKDSDKTLSPFLLEDGRFSKLYAELMLLGLTANQAKIYLYLLSRPVSSVRTISKALDLHRVDVYRKLHELEGLGMVETMMGEPRSYSATSPRVALSSFLQKEEDRVQNLRHKSKSLILELDALTDSVAGNERKSSEPDSSYRMVVGRRSYHNEVRALIRDAKYDILRIVSPTAIIRTFYFGIYDEYVKAKKRGVSLRMISQINSQNSRYAKRLAKVVELRHLDDVHIRFLVADKSVSVISARFDEKSYSLDSTEDNFLVFKDSKLSESFCFFFEHLWSHAQRMTE